MCHPEYEFDIKQQSINQSINSSVTYGLKQLNLIKIRLKLLLFYSSVTLGSSTMSINDTLK